jgi:lysophospholipase L1-like esterase
MKPDRGSLALLVGSTMIAGAFGYRAYHTWVRPRTIAPAANPYEVTLVDPHGRALSAKPGALKLALDPFTLYRNLPNQETPLFNIDDRGYRLGSPRRDGAPVVVLGGSAVFGVGLERDDDTFPAQLAALVPSSEFVNAGVSGFLSGQELGEMVHRADRLRPRAYVVFDGWNDLFVQAFTGSRPGPEYGFNLSMFDEVRDRLERVAVQDGARHEDRPRSDLDPAEWRQGVTSEYLANLERMAVFAKGRGAAFLVVFQPYLARKRSLTPAERVHVQEWHRKFPGVAQGFDPAYRDLIAEARRHCTRQGIAFLDLTDEPRLMETGEEMFVDSVHPSALGHRVIAEILAPKLQP